MERKATVQRTTAETDISIELLLDSTRASAIDTGVPFLDHMLAAMAKHGRFTLSVRCTGDTHIDDHHSVEDIGICLGRAFKDALGEKQGISRFGDITLPMDDTLTLVAVDLSGRPYYRYHGPALTGTVGAFSEELTDEFLRSFATNAGINLHVHVFHGNNKHHIHETIYKGLGLALYRAASADPLIGGGVLSTKGTIA